MTVLHIALAWLTLAVIVGLVIGAVISRADDHAERQAATRRAQ